MTAVEWLRALSETSPEPLSRRRSDIVLVAALVTAASRILTMACTPWDWDEFLFLFAVDRFDVSQHHPHPPGFPLFILGAKLLHALGLDHFHALQAVNVIAAAVLVPAMFLLCRELRIPFVTSLSAALLLAFFPNVWFFGGTAFSDVASLTLVVLAVALLLAGCRDAWAYLGGATLLGIAAGFRPQNLLIGIVPLILASAIQLRRGVGRIIAAAFIIAGIVAVSYGTAAWLTGWNAYLETVRGHGRFIVSTDSFRAPDRPSLWGPVLQEFFLQPYRAPLANIIVTVFGVVSIVASIVRRRWQMLLAMATFVPFCLFAWLMLDHLSAGRFSIAYAPLVALLAADGVRIAMRSARAEVAGDAVILIVMIAWALPAFTGLRIADSPPAAAALWLRQHANERTAVIYVDEAMKPAAEWYLPHYRRMPLPATGAVPESAYQLREGRQLGARVLNFTHPRDRLWRIVRRRYFEVFVVVPGATS